MRPTRLALYFLLGLLLLAATAVAALLLVDPDVFHDQLEARASDAFGRAFRIGGAIGIERSLRPQIILEEITIDNPDGAAGPHFAQADQVAVRVALLPLLRGKLRIMDVTFTGVEIHIEDGPGGANNYSFGEGGVFDATRQLPLIERMLVRDTVINYRPAAGPGRRLEIAAARIWNIPGEPERIEAEGVAQGMPYSLKFTAEPDAERSGPQNPWSVKLDMQGAGLTMLLEGQMNQAFAWRQLEGRIVIRGDETDKLALLLGTELPPAGPFNIAAAINSNRDVFKLTGLSGQIEKIAGRHDIKIADGEISSGRENALTLNLQGTLDDAPLVMTFRTGPASTGESGRHAWPLELQATLPGTKMKGKGFIAAPGVQPRLEIATHLEGDRLEALGSLIGIALPPIGPYDLKADLRSGEGVHDLQDIQLQLGAERVRGQLKWQDQTPRSSLTGRLTADRLAPAALIASRAPPSGSAGLPIDLGWFQTLEVRVDIAIAHLMDFPIPVSDMTASVTIADGGLTAPFRAQMADAPLKGQVTLQQSGDTPQITLQATTGRIDALRAFKQVELPGVIDGTVEAIRLEGRSSGQTWPELLERAVVNVQLRPANVRYAGQIIGRPIDLLVEAAEFTTKAGQPLRATFTGKFQGLHFDAQAGTARLAELASTQTPLPIRLDLKTANMAFKGRGTVARPIEKKVFDLEHEIAGDEIEGLDPLVDLAISLHGAFNARGIIAGRGDRVTYNEVLQVGKSDFKMTMNIDHAAPLPKVTAEITSKKLYLEDVNLLPGGDEAEKNEYLIPDFSLPVDYLRASDLEIDVRAQRVHSDIGDLGELAMKVTVKDGHFESTSTISKPEGARLREFLDLNAAVNPPVYRYEVDGEKVDYTILRRLVPIAVLEGGGLDFHLRLSGTGTTRRQFLSHADGLLTIIGGPGQLQERRIDLWAADLTTTLLSPKWQKQETTAVNCMVARIGVVDGLATIDNMLLDTQRVTIAGSGVINLKDETLDVYIAPRPKNASLVSLANPVNITGKLSQPEISVAKLPGRKHRLARTGLLAGLINPLFLLTTLTDTGTFGAESCTEAIEQAEASLEEIPP